MIRVMLTDDHVLIREGIKHLLEFDGTIMITEEAALGKECLDKLEKNLPDILLLDINMPEMNGIEVLEKIKRREWKVKVLMLTVHNETEYLLKAMDIGADGYILKDSDSAELKKAIYMIMDGKTYIQPNLIPAFNSRLISRDTDQDKIKTLTKREVEILISIADGMINKEIAEKYKISEYTVRNHISNIFKKIQVADRTQAAVFAIKNDLIKLY